MNDDLAIRLRQACHDRLPGGTVPLTAIRFLHWAPGNDYLWAGLEQCLAEYMGASINGRARDPMLFFGLHSDTAHFPASYRELFTLGAGYLPYGADHGAVIAEWRRVVCDVLRPLPDTLKKPYIDSLHGLLRSVRHMFKLHGTTILDYRRELERDIINDKKLQSRPLCNADQQRDLDRLWLQYNVFLNQLDSGGRSGETLQQAFLKFEANWNDINEQKQKASSSRDFSGLIKVLNRALQSHTHFISCIKNVEQGFTIHEN